MTEKTQQEIDDEEWHNPANWAGMWPCSVYFSKRDSRIWAPAIWNNMWSFRTLNFEYRFRPLTQFILFMGVLAMLCFAFSAARRLPSPSRPPATSDRAP